MSAVHVEEERTPARASPDLFWAFAAKLPSTEAEFAAQQQTFRAWRADPRYELHWPTIDLLLARDFASTQKWAVAQAAAQQLRDDGYDFEAWKEQREFDAKNAANLTQ
jgi:hypothetical protein